jgi:DNA invertase Pin-like site-specific DNA recombinase
MRGPLPLPLLSVRPTPNRSEWDKALDAARSLLDQGWSWRAVAEATGIQKDTLRRRLKEVESLSQNPPPDQAA